MMDNTQTPFGSTLIIGAGPAGIHAAVNWSKMSRCVGLLNRKGKHSQKVNEALENNHFQLDCEVQVSGHQHISSRATVECFYDGYDELADLWDTIVIATPSDCYAQVIIELQRSALRNVKQVILLSPGLGSNAWVQHLWKDARGQIEVISFSTYYAASKFSPASQKVLKTVVKGIKRKVWIASSQAASSMSFVIKELVESLGIQCVVVHSPLEAECRSITTYVHPPFFMSEFSLHEIFREERSRKHMYKLYPEGPITPHAIHVMVQLWKEISHVLDGLHINSFNLLKFLNDDNYPVHEMSISRASIENFQNAEQITQEYLLYTRYASLLIDPFSIPNEQGKYFDFSAVPYKQVSLDEHGFWIIPRVPYEDYKKLLLIRELGQLMGILLPQTQHLITQFENKLNAFAEEKGRSHFRQELFEDQSNEQALAILHSHNVQVHSSNGS